MGAHRNRLGEEILMNARGIFFFFFFFFFLWGADGDSPSIVMEYFPYLVYWLTLVFLFVFVFFFFFFFCAGVGV